MSHYDVDLYCQICNNYAYSMEPFSETRGIRVLCRECNKKEKERIKKEKYKDKCIRFLNGELLNWEDE